MLWDRTGIRMCEFSQMRCATRMRRESDPVQRELEPSCHTGRVSGVSQICTGRPLNSNASALPPKILIPRAVSPGRKDMASAVLSLGWHRGNTSGYVRRLELRSIPIFQASTADPEHQPLRSVESCA
jgi:hypothetical protein